MKKYNIVFAVLSLFALSGCIQETLPSEYVLAPQIQKSESALKGMVNSIYTTMAGYSNDDGGVEEISYGSMLAMLEHGTTQLVCSGTNGYNTMGAYCTGSVSAVGSNRGLYPSYLFYAYVKTVNDVIGMIGTDPAQIDETKKGYLGICYAYRALYYMDVVQIMEYKTPTDKRYTYTAPENDLKNIGVPIVTEKTTSKEASNNKRATVDEVYDLILSDLKQAETYLTGYQRTDKVQPNLAVVYGLYARAYTNLASRVATSATYKDEATYWGNAKSYAEKAISESGCTPLTEDQWTDPVNGFNNRDSQSSCMPGQCPVINIRPCFGKFKTYYSNYRIKYDNADLLKAAELMLKADSKTPTFAFDVSNLVRQVVSNHFAVLFKDYEKAYNENNYKEMKAKEALMLQIINDVDRLVSSQSFYLTGKWIKEARSKGINDEEKLYYERNARNLLTTWGEKAGLLNDYASRTWSGMTSTFYGERWKMFFAAVDKAVIGGYKFDDAKYKEYEKEVTDYEEIWWKDCIGDFPETPVGDSIELAKELLAKYKTMIEQSK